MHDRDDRPAGNEVLARAGPAFLNGAIKWRTNHRIGELLARDFHLRATLRELGQAVVHLLHRVAKAIGRDLVSGIRRLAFGLGENPLLIEFHDPVAVLAGFLQARLCFLHRAGLVRVNLLIVARQRETESRPRLTQQGFRLGELKPVVLRLHLRDELALAHAAAEIDRERLQPARHFDAQGGFVMRGQGANHRNRAFHHLVRDCRNRDGARDPG